MHIAIRVDASLAIGSGHVMRCVALASFLTRNSDVRVCFVCREHRGHYCEWLIDQGYPVLRLPSPQNLESEADIGGTKHGNWLGVTQAQDCSESRSVLEGRVWDWLIVDHYGLDAEWETGMRTCANRLMAIDDLADRCHNVDLLLDQNLQGTQNRYRNLVSSNCILLLGPQYALLRSEFSEFRANKGYVRTGILKRILVFMGGSDPDNLTTSILRIVDRIGIDVRIDVVMGRVAPHLNQVRNLCASIENCHLHVQTDEMAGLMWQSDLMIGAPGSATWERCSLGLPSILIPFASNQKEVGRQVARHRAAILIDGDRSLLLKSFEKIFVALVNRPHLLVKLARRAAGLTDGRGCERVVSALKSSLKICITSDKNSWLNKYLPELLVSWRADGHSVEWVHDVAKIQQGDLAFYLGCGQLASADVLRRNTHNLVVHESRLPNGRGWSPLTWQILEGKNVIPISLIEAQEGVDSGCIYLEQEMTFRGHELIGELRASQAAVTLAMCREFVADYPQVVSRSRPQKGAPTFYLRRRPVDSRLDLGKSLAEQFNLLRVVDNDRYPAYFEYFGHRYVITIAEDAAAL